MISLLVGNTCRCAMVRIVLAITQRGVGRCEAASMDPHEDQVIAELIILQGLRNARSSGTIVAPVPCDVLQEHFP